MSTPSLSRCASALLNWYASNKRDFLWRQSTDAYRIWISEIMLQQTRIEAALPYYERFLDECPDVFALAALPEDRLMKLWEGLGYYSRARNLQKAARIIVDEYDGSLPKDYEKLLKLPGIGEYTAGAIASIAYNIPVPAVDGNVMRVLSRLTGDSLDVMSTQAKRHFGKIVDGMMPRDNAGDFNQALMELGETVCVPNGLPNCSRCPWNHDCYAFREDCVQDLPVRSKSKARRIEARTVAVVIVGKEPACVLLQKRPKSGLLADLWQLPNVLSEDTDNLLPPQISDCCRYVSDLPTAKHIFSHVEWHMVGRLYRASHCELPKGYCAVSLQELEREYALPTAFRAYAALLPQLLQREDM